LNFRRLVWFWMELTWRDWLGLLLVMIVAGAILFLWGPFPDLYRRANFGFGPDWECSYAGKGEPVCVRRRATGP
jgi:hypothetical protein